MNSNNLDNIIKKRKTSNTSFYFKIAIVIFGFLVLFSIPISLFYMGKIDGKSYEIKTNGEQYGKSNFFKYQGKVYVFTLNDGMKEIKNVDITTFKAFEPGDYFTQNIALDKNSVYFGNVIISDLNPNKLKVIGNGYYTDGTNTYFYSPFSEFDKDSSKYIYPYKKMENVKNLKALKDFELFAVDGENVYYKGEILKNADLNTLEIIDRNNEYFADKENVYYKSKLLPIKNSGKLKIVSSEQGDEFLYDEANGYVFMENYSFDREKAPYKVLGNKGNHLYNLVFVNNEGIYYYDNQKKKQLRAGDNIFVGNVEELSPNVFMDNENIYYFHAYEVQKRLKHSSGYVLASRNTVIYSLGKKDAWEKVNDIESGTVGSIWKKENKYYYFDNLGIFQLIDNAIYEIRDKETLEYLLNYNEGSSKIRELIENEKLIKIEGEKKIEIRVKYTTFFLPFKISGLLAFILGIVIAKVSHYFREKKNAKKF